MSPAERDGTESRAGFTFLDFAAPCFGLATASLVFLATVWVTSDAVTRRLVPRSDAVLLAVVICSAATAIGLWSATDILRAVLRTAGVDLKSQQPVVGTVVGQMRRRAFGPRWAILVAGVVSAAVAIVGSMPIVPDQVELNEVLLKDSASVDAIEDAGYFAVDDSAQMSLAALPTQPSVFFVLNDESRWDISQVNRDAQMVGAGDISTGLAPFFAATGLSSADVDIGAFDELRESEVFRDLVASNAQIFVLNSFQAFPIESGER